MRLRILRLGWAPLAFEPSQHFRTVVFVLDSAGKSGMFVANVLTLRTIAIVRGEGDVSLHQEHF